MSRFELIILYKKFSHVKDVLLTYLHKDPINKSLNTALMRLNTKRSYIIIAKIIYFNAYDVSLEISI